MANLKDFCITHQLLGRERRVVTTAAKYLSNISKMCYNTNHFLEIIQANLCPLAPQLRTEGFCLSKRLLRISLYHNPSTMLFNQ